MPTLVYCYYRTVVVVVVPFIRAVANGRVTGLRYRGIQLDRIVVVYVLYMWCVVLPIVVMLLVPAIERYCLLPLLRNEGVYQL